jgi:hypothetical protein
MCTQFLHHIHYLTPFPHVPDDINTDVTPPWV